MSTTRQDAWTEEDDLLLAETVLRHIREGSTQLLAFEEVGRNLSRTSAACGFRWNSLVRKQYETAIMLAKKQRKELQNKKQTQVKRRRTTSRKTKNESKADHLNQKTEDSGSEQWGLADIIGYLEKFKETETLVQTLETKNEKLEKTVAEVTAENNALENEIRRLRDEYMSVEKDYQAMLSVLAKARKLIEIQEEEEKKTPSSV